MKRHSLMLLMTFLIAATPALAEADASCKPVLEATKAKAAAPAFHDRKTMDGVTIEAIKVGETLYGNDGSGWKLLSSTASATLGGFDQQVASGVIRVGDCKKLGRESVDGRSTTVYQFKTTIQGLPPAIGRVWIGDDGRPYREGADGVDGTVTYTGVSAPAVKPKKR